MDWMRDPATGKPVGPIDGRLKPRPVAWTTGWMIERDANGLPVRMRWVERGERITPAIEVAGGDRMRRVYLAGRFSRRAEFNGYAGQLRSWGLTVDARWLVEDHEWYGEQDEAAIVAARGFAKDDLEDVAAADIVMVFTEPVNPGGRNRGGRHVEYGIALALHKDILIVGPPENVFHNLTGAVFVSDGDSIHTPATRIGHAASFDDVRALLVRAGHIAETEDAVA